jgi:PadR family transcriptional regulator, regulatory protein PadR
MGTSITYTGALVLQALVRGHAYGFDIVHATNLPTGTVYPLLRRLEARGLVRSRWEKEAAAHAEGRPARRNYAPTAAGEAALAEALKRIRSQQAVLDDAPANGSVSSA